MDEANLLDRVLALLDERLARYCVIGGVAVNAYVEPVVTLDLDLVIAAADRPGIEAAFEREFRVERFPHSLNVSVAQSDLRIQIQTDDRYVTFVDRAVHRDVLGVRLPVAAIDDVLQGKIWAASDPGRRPSKRQKDLADIARLIEARPDLRPLVPPDILAKLVW